MSRRLVLVEDPSEPMRKGLISFSLLLLKGFISESIFLCLSPELIVVPFGWSLPSLEMRNFENDVVVRLESAMETLVNDESKVVSLVRLRADVLGEVVEDEFLVLSESKRG